MNTQKMAKITFKKYGLSPEEVENMKKFNLKLDKRTMKQLISAYQTENINMEELENLENLIGFSLPTDYKNFLLQNNGCVPSKSRIKSLDKVIDHFFALKSAYKYNSIIDLYENFATIGVPIAQSPSGDTFVMNKNAEIYCFDHNLTQIDEEMGCIAKNFSDFLAKLY